jgi:hypothetical protein
LLNKEAGRAVLLAPPRMTVNLIRSMTPQSKSNEHLENFNRKAWPLRPILSMSYNAKPAY